MTSGQQGATNEASASRGGALIRPETPWTRDRRRKHGAGRMEDPCDLLSAVHGRLRFCGAWKANRAWKMQKCSIRN